MRTLAIGDIHGCYRSLRELERFAEFHESDRIVTLGDHVDRGPDSRSVIEWLISRSELDLVALNGNHESMMLAARRSLEHQEEWLSVGGDKVLESYQARCLSEIPIDHWEFLEHQLKPYFQLKDHLFVHANVYPELDLEEQPDYMLFWDSSVERSKHHSGRIIICGHTPQRNGIPLDMGHAICIDTAACKGGWLTCLDVNARYCWQANEQGETRSFWLDEGPRPISR